MSESKWLHTVDFAAITYMELMEENVFTVAIQKLTYFIQTTVLTTYTA